MNSLSTLTEVAKLVSDDMVKIANKQRLQDFFFISAIGVTWNHYFFVH